MQLTSRPTVQALNPSRPVAHRRIAMAVFTAAGSAVLLLNPGQSMAQVTKTWTSADTGGAQTFWSDASRWASFQVPDATTTNIVYYTDTNTLIGNVRSTNNAGAVTTYSALTAVTVNGQGTNSGTSTLTIDGTGITYANPASIKINSLNGSGGGLTVNYNIASTYNAASTIDASAATAQVNYGSQLLGTGDLTLTAPSNGNTLVLTSGNTSRLANTTIAGGVVEGRGGTNNFFANSISNFVRVQSGARLVINPQNTAATNSATLIINGTGPDTNGALQFTNVGSGSYNFLGLVVESAATLNISGTNTLTLNSFSGATGLSGTGTLTKTGTGNLTILKAAAATTVGGSFSAFSGNLNWTAGTLTLTTSGNVNNVLGATATSTVSVTGGAVVTWNYGGNGASTQTQIFSINGTGTGTGALVIQGVKFGNAVIGGLRVATDATLNITQAGSNAADGSIERGLTLSTGLSGSGNLTKTGSGYLYPNIANSTFSGNINVNTGVIFLPSNANTLGSSSSQLVTIASGAAVQSNWGGNGAYNVPQSFAINGTGTGNYVGALSLTGIRYGNPNIGGLNVQSDSTVNFAWAGTGNGDGAVIRGVNVNGAMSGAGTLTKIGNAAMYVNIANGTFTGNVNLSAGQIELAGVNNALGANASGTQTVTVNSGTGVNLNNAGSAPQNFSITGTGAGVGNSVAALSQFNGGNYSVGSVTLTGSATVSAAGMLTVAGSLYGSNTLTKIGAGTLYVGGSNPSTFTGNINVSNGILQMNVNNSLGSGPNTVTVSSGAAVTAGNLFAQRTYPQLFVINGNGTGNGALYLTALDNFGGNTTIGGLTVASDATVNFVRHVNGNNNPNTGVRVLTALAGSGTLSKSGNASLYLTTGGASFTGNVNVNAGIVELSGVTNALGGNGSGTQTVTVASSAGVNFAGTGSAPQSFSVSGSGTGYNNSNGVLSKYGSGTYDIGAVTLAGGSTISAETGTLNITGAVGGSGGLTKVGSGTVALSGSTNTSSGPVQINAGTLSVGNAGATGVLGSGDVTVNANTALIFNRTGTLTVANTISGSGIVSATAGGTTTLTGSLAGFAGTVLVSGNATSLVTNQPLTPATGSLVVAGAGASFTFAVPASGGYTTVGSLASIDVQPTNTVRIAPTSRTSTNASVLVTSSLSLNGNSGFLDLGNNDLIVRGGGSANASSLESSINAWINSPVGAKVGLGTTQAGQYNTLAVLLNDAGDGTPLFDSYDGVTGLTSSDTIVKYTYIGDTNFDGKLDGLDFKAVLEGYLTGQTGWQHGDVNYSGGAVDATDISSFLAVYNAVSGNVNAVNYGTGAGTGSGGGAVVPEPSSLGLMLVGAPLLRRRRR